MGMFGHSSGSGAAARAAIDILKLPPVSGNGFRWGRANMLNVSCSA